MRPEVLYVGGFDIRGLFEQVALARAPSNHLHGVPHLQDLGFAVRTLPSEASVPRGGAALQRAVARAVDEGGPPAMVLAHSHREVPRLALLRRLRRWAVPLAAFVHSMAPRPWDRLWLQGFDLLLPLTRLAERQLQSLGLRAPVQRVPYGADLGFYPTPTNAQARDIVLSVGVCGRDYGTLIDAASEIALPMHIVGRLLPHERQRADAAGIAVHSSGRYDLPFAQLMALYRRAACVVVTTHGGGHPYGVNALVEAMAMGCPVVVTEGDGLDLDPAAGGFGLRVPAHDAAALATSVNLLTLDARSVRAMGERARAVAEGGAHARGMAETVAQALQGLIARPPA